MRGAPLAARAYEWIKGRIVTFELHPGSVVIASDVAHELGVSVTPVHEALKRLCLEGMAQVIPRTGYVIAPVTLSDVQEIFTLRVALEPLALDIGMQRATDRDLAAFRAAVYETPARAPRGRRSSVEVWQHLNFMGEVHDDFHVAAATLSGNRRLVRIIRELLDQGRRLTLMCASTLPLVQPDRPGPMGAHRTIADAVEARDREAAVAAMADHVKTEHRRVVEFLSALRAEPLSSADVDGLVKVGGGTAEATNV